MGARAKRRLLIGAITVVALVAGAVVGGFQHFGAATGGGSSAGSQAATALNNGPTLIYGMTEQQVQRITGAPTKTQGNCWFFVPRRGMVGKIPMANTYPAAAHEGYLRLCFASGLFTSAARQILASEMTVSPFPGGNALSTPASGWTWTGWVQNPERGSCRAVPSACVQK